MIMSSSSIVDFYVADVRQDWLYYVILRTGHTKLSPVLGHVIILNKDVDFVVPLAPSSNITSHCLNQFTSRATAVCNPGTLSYACFISIVLFQSRLIILLFRTFPDHRSLQRVLSLCKTLMNKREIQWIRGVIQL